MTVSEKRIRFHLHRQQRLKSKRQNWDNLWQDLSDYFCPGRITAIRREEEGARKTKKIYDNTGADAAQKLAAGLYSRTVNPASKWFYITLETADEELENNKEINNWFDIARDRTQSVINKRGTGALYQTYCDLTSLCNAVLFIQEDPISGISFRTYPIDRVDIAEDYRGVVDTVYRKFEMTLRQIDQEFPGKLPHDKLQQMETEPDAKAWVLHVVAPRKDRDPDKIDNLNMPFESLYILCEGPVLLEESGYPEMPYAVARLEVLAGELYGRGPATIALPEVKSLNEMAKLQLDGSNMRLRPPLDVPLNAYVNPIQLIPGYKNLNQDEGGRRVTALNVAGDLQYTAKDIELQQNKVKEIFYNDQLYLRTNAEMTATEVQKRSEIQMQLMGPWQGRLELELFEPMINRILGILIRQGEVPPPPQELLENADNDTFSGRPEGYYEESRMQLAGKKSKKDKKQTPKQEAKERQKYSTRALKIVYDSPLARAQRLVDVQVIDQVKMSIAQSMQLNPQGAQDYLMRFDMVQMEVDRAKALGLPTKYIISQEEYEQAKAQMQQQQQQMQAMQQMGAMADVGQKVGNTPGGEQLTQQMFAQLGEQMGGEAEAEGNENG
jgi:hypothetical protein